MMDEQRLNDIRQRAEAATPGLWTTWKSQSEVFFEKADVGILTEDGVIIGEFWEGCAGPGNQPYIRPAALNADFACHARQDIPDLLDALAAERERAAQLEALVKTAAEWMYPWCVWCANKGEGHAQDCPRQAALKE